MAPGAERGDRRRVGLEIRGTKGVIQDGFGALSPAYLREDPTWMPGKSKAPWQEITSAGVGKPEPLMAADVGNGNLWCVQDLLNSIAEDRPPLDSLADGRASLERILAVYESHQLEKPVDLPLKNRKHPLQGM